MNWSTYAVGFAVSLVSTAVLLPPAISLAHRYELLDLPGRHKRHKRPVPILGGAVLFLALWAGVAGSYFAFPGFFGDLAGSLVFIFAGATIVFLIGLSDDLSPLSAWIKLFAQVAAGLLLYLGGLKIDPLSIPFMGSHEIGGFSVVITVTWVVILTNAINLIDGLDGLAGGVSLVGALTLAVIGAIYQIGPAAMFAYAMIGFLVIFLFYNRYPARIFLGDSGSLQIGFYFAVISLLVPVKSYTAAALYLPLMALGVPLLEASVSVTRRLVTQRNVMKADRRHLFHYLALAGLSQRQTVLIFYLLSIVFGLFAVAMYFLHRLVVFGFLILFMVVILTLFFIFMANLNRFGRRRRRADK